MWQYTGQRRPEFAETPAPGQESVWDYPRPPILDACARIVEVWDGERCIARSEQAVRVLETASPPTVYLPPTQVETSALVELRQSSICEWKGAARYWALASTPREAVAWSYSAPTRRFADLAGWFSFYPGRIRCLLDGETVRPQGGGFYGGWVTHAIVGPWKGQPGTGGW